MNKNQENSFWEKQKEGKWKTLTSPLSQDPEIFSNFDDFITTFYWKFREHKGVEKGTYNPEIDFQGFAGFEDFEEEIEMGHCDLHIDIISQQTPDGKKVENSEVYEGKMSIKLNQKYLLDRLGMDKFISNYQENEKGTSWSTLPVGFNKLIETIAHELAHAYQNTIRIDNGETVKSQCESSGDKKQYPRLVAEHTQLTKEIENMIANSTEYQEFKSWWDEGKNQQIVNKNYVHTQKKDNKELDPNSKVSDELKELSNPKPDNQSSVESNEKQIESNPVAVNSNSHRSWWSQLSSTNQSLIVGGIVLAGIISLVIWLTTRKNKGRKFKG
ncbi:hypothetical protein [endosymbiont GvMRE of Glomus versiforme]|uniref:hypothetical protein n=1 Tax=endosymbiont GvMRE of Glomus versiforme TaxID=2039283 RepID=UPI000EECB5FE|nr:hypothetical protein [endosymbiont GvMRE of Glomus versiforme]RHZ37702.1 hypothetical protein GvMRE_I1g236 [endosymbiont GvMRE of Glomus versiforme]